MAFLLEDVGPEETKNDLPSPKLLRFKRLQNMKCFGQVVAMIESSMPARVIAAYIQEEAHEYCDVTKRYLTMLIQQYIGSHSISYIDDQVPTKHIQLTNSLSEHVNPMDVYQVLLAVHSDRILMDYAAEKKIGRTNPQNSNNVRIMNDILRSMAQIETERKYKFQERQNTRGVEDTLHALDRVKRQYAERWGDAAAGMILNPDSRRRILNALEQARSGGAGPLADLLKQRTAEDADKAIIDAATESSD